MGFSVIGFGGRLLLINDPVSTGNNLPELNDSGAITETGIMNYDQSIQNRVRVPQRRPRHQSSAEVLGGIAFG
jgi:hypothetical protein